MSKGTCIAPNDSGSEPKILLAVRSDKEDVSVVFSEIGANIITVGSFKDDMNRTMFKTFISQTRPAEIIFQASGIDSNMMRILRNCIGNPVLSPLNDPQAWVSIKGYEALEKYHGLEENWPDTFKTVLSLEDEFIKNQIIATFSGFTQYLTKMLIVENILKTAKYDFYDLETYKLSRMVLDSQALQHLEILEVQCGDKILNEGSLLDYLDRTVSKMGKRLLRKWVCAPLLDIVAINDRLDALEDLENLEHDCGLRTILRETLMTLPDLERMCCQIYNQSIKNKQNVVMFEDVAGSRLRQFKKTLDSLEKAKDLIARLSKQKYKSRLLGKLTTIDCHQEIINGTSPNIPEISPILAELSKFLVWDFSGKKEQPSPKFGVDSEYDQCLREISKLENELQHYLEIVKENFRITIPIKPRIEPNNRLKKETPSNYTRDDLPVKERRLSFGQDGYDNESDISAICYAHTKHRYEIEVPTKLVAGERKPKDFEFSSKKIGKERFITKEIKLLVDRLELAETNLKGKLNFFICSLFSYFYKHRKVWDRIIEGLSQLDCLASLSLVSFCCFGIMCRPKLYLHTKLNTEGVFLEVREMRHPCVSQIKTNFVANDILLGDVDDNGCSRNLMFLTGPNAGGKSTLMRQTALLVIMAQIGCFVPASKCAFSLVDRIFTRLGASDQLTQNKSTFFIEMEETLTMLKYSSPNSLAIYDELGKGTSTFCGISMCCGILNYIIDKSKCRTLFATHYHILLDEYRDNPKYIDSIMLYYMDFKIDKDDVTFLYKLVEGECSSSLSLNIARMCGIDPTIISRAKEKTNDFVKNFDKEQKLLKTNKTLKSQNEVCYEEINTVFTKCMDMLLPFDS